MASYLPPKEQLAVFNKDMFSTTQENTLVGTTSNINSSIISPISAFGEVLTTNLLPISHLIFNYNVINQQESIQVINGGSISASSGLLNVSSGGTINNYAYLNSRKSLVYRPGEGCMSRFTALFTTPTLTSGTQYAGMGNVISGVIQDGLGFGYNYGSTEFGIFYFTSSSGVSVKTFIPQSSWNVDTFNATTSNNIINPIYGNVFQIEYQYLGFGDLFFSIENRITGRFQLVHRIQFANSSLLPSLSNPTMALLWYAFNDAGSASVTVKSGSGALFLQGSQQADDYKYTYDFFTNVPNNSALKNIFALRSVSTINSIINRGLIQLTSLTIGASSTNACAGVLQLILCPLNTETTPNFTRWSVTPTFTSISNVPNQSIASVSGPLYGVTPTLGTLATTNTGLSSYSNSLTAGGGGLLFYSVAFASPSSQFVDLSSAELYISANEIISFAVKASNACDIAISVTWGEAW